MCNASDLRSECANPHETRKIPERILLYDQHPGGIGISKKVSNIVSVMLSWFFLKVENTYQNT